MASDAVDQASTIFELRTRLMAMERSVQLENSTVGSDDDTVSVADAVADAADVASSFGGLQDILDSAADDVAAAGAQADAAAEAAAQAGEDGLEAAAAAQEAADEALANAANAVEAAEDAVAKGQAALTAAQDASTAASTAQGAAQAALTSANGKTTTKYSPNAPVDNGDGTWTPPGVTVGDQWFVRDSSTGVVSAQFEWTSAGNWMARILASAVIASLDAGKITAGYISAARIAAGTVTGDLIAANTIKTANLAANSVTAAVIAAATITSAQIAANTITAAQIAADGITAATLAADAVLARNIKAGEVTAGKLAANSVVALNITGGTITGDKLVANTVTAREIKAASITTALLSADAINGMTITGATLQTANPTAQTPRLTLAGSTMLGYAGTAASNLEFFRLDTSGGGLIRMSQQNSGTVTINGTTWTGGGIVFTQPVYGGTTPVHLLGAPGIGWFLNTANVESNTDYWLIFGAPNLNNGKTGPSFSGMALTDDAQTNLQGGGVKSTGATALGLADTNADLQGPGVQGNLSVASITLGWTAQRATAASRQGGGNVLILGGFSDSDPAFLRMGSGMSSNFVPNQRPTTSNVVLGAGAPGSANSTGANLSLTATQGNLYGGTTTAAGVPSRIVAGASSVQLTMPGASASAIVPTASLNANYWQVDNALINSSLTYAQVVTGRNVVINSNGTLGYASSTERHKYDVEELVMTDELLEAVMSISPSTFLVDSDFRETPQRQGGFIAERFHDAGLHEYVDYGADENGEMTDRVEGLWYDRVPAIEWAWLKRMQAELDELKASR